LKASLWIIIAALAGTLAWMLLSGEPTSAPNPVAEAPGPVPAEPSPKTVSLPDGSTAEQEALRKAVLSGDYAKPAAPQDDINLDIVCLSDGTELEGRIVSKTPTSVSIRVVGGTEVRHVPRKRIVKITSHRERTAARARKWHARQAPEPADGGEEEGGEKSELRMTASEWHKHQLKKRIQRQEERRNRPAGIRAIDMARDLNRDAKNRAAKAGLGETGKEE